MSAKIQTGLRLEEEMYEKLKVLSAQEGRTLNNMAEHIIRLYLLDYETRVGKIVRPSNK